MTRLRRWMACVALVGVTLIVTGGHGILAQQAQNEFKPVPASELQERLPATPLVFAAYAFVWIALVAYVFVLWRRLGRVERELAEIRSKTRR